MLLTGVSCVIVTEIYCAVMQREFQKTDNRIGKAFAIVGIYLFVVCYCKFVSSPFNSWILKILIQIV